MTNPTTKTLKTLFAKHDKLKAQTVQVEHQLRETARTYADEQGLRALPRLETLRQGLS